MNNILPSQKAQEAITVGFKNHWRFRVIGSGQIPPRPFYKNEWWFEPLQNAPAKAQDRLYALRKAGITYKGFVIAHEAPRLLMAPKEEKVEIKQSMSTTANFPILEIVGLIISLFFRAILLDPALIVILDDGTWLELMTWYE